MAGRLLLANTKSALKAHRVSERRHERNRAVKSALRTFVKKARVAVAGTPSDDAADQIKEAAKRLDQAATKGIIHPNQAARRKSRLMRQLVVAQKSEVVEAPAKPTRARRTPATKSTGAKTTTTRTRTTRAKTPA
jgi:small subunit ribosomal protein S20